MACASGAAATSRSASRGAIADLHCRDASKQHPTGDPPSPTKTQALRVQRIDVFDSNHV